MRSGELKSKICCASIVPLHKEENEDVIGGDGNPSNPIHVQTLETRAPRRCSDSLSRNAEDRGKNAGSIGHINHALHILGAMTPSPRTPLWDLRGKVLRTIRVAF